MRLVLFVLVTLFIAIIITLAAIENPGYVLISRAPWSIEMPLTLFLPLLVVGFFVGAALLYAFIRLTRIPRDVTRWRTRKHLRQARTSLVQGYIKLAEGDFTAAEAELVAGLRHGEIPLLNNLAAAYCAQEQGAIEKRDEYLANAQRSAPQHAAAVGMIQARLQYLARQSEQALATLAGLRQSQPRHRYLLKLLAQVYLQLRDWTGIVELIPELRNQGAMAHKDIDALELQANRELLQLALPSGAREILVRAWNAVPKSLRQDSTLVAVYARQLILQNEMRQAEMVLQQALDHQWNTELAMLFGHVHGEHPAEQLAQAEGWLVSHPSDAVLYLSCGRLALRANELGKAREYFEKSIGFNGPVEAHRELGALYERMGEKDRAITAYRHGLEAYVAENPGLRKPNGAPQRYRLAR